MRWRLILEEFDPNIHHISRVDSIVSDTLIILPSTTIDQDEPINSKYINKLNYLFTNREEQSIYDRYHLDISLIHREQQKELININIKISAYMWGPRSGYSQQVLDDVKIIWFDKEDIFDVNSS